MGKSKKKRLGNSRKNRSNSIKWMKILKKNIEILKNYK